MYFLQIAEATKYLHNQGLTLKGITMKHILMYDNNILKLNMPVISEFEEDTRPPTRLMVCFRVFSLFLILYITKQAVVVFILSHGRWFSQQHRLVCEMNFSLVSNNFFIVLQGYFGTI